ncbi:MAG: hypothetical protein U9Q79_03780, partial [Candidatus Hydrogenedentes bacterium]|nr:hypothetical protein [Candidatus Hydrogenedentota bacterium]
MARRLGFCCTLITVLAACAGAQEVTYRAALVTPASEEWLRVRDMLEKQLADARYEVMPFGFDQLCDPAKLTIDRIDLLVLPDASTLPAQSTDVVVAFLKAGGDIFACNTPMWRDQLIDDDGTWARPAGYQRKHARDLLENVLFDFDTTDLSQWQRSSNNMSSPASHEIVEASDAPFDRALHVKIGVLNNWDTFVSPDLNNPFPEGHTLTVFWAKGTERTTTLAVEWTEKDGSRWIATVELAPEWRQYILGPKDFRFWQSVPARAETALNPANVAHTSIGLALTHTPIGGRNHEYWVGPFGTAKRSPMHEKLLTVFKSPVLETLSPEYKFFECMDVRRLEHCIPLPGDPLERPVQVLSSHPRPGPAGFDKGRDWRWSPLIEAFSKDGEWRGNPATLYVNADGPYKGGVWVSFSVPEPKIYTESQSPLRRVVPAALQFIKTGIFLLDSGSNYFTYFEDQTAELGARVVNVGKDAVDDLWVSLSLSDRGIVKEWPLALAPGEIGRVSTTLSAADLPAEGLSVNVLVSDAPLQSAATADGEARTKFRTLHWMDEAQHPIHIWWPKEKKSFVTVEAGDFMLEGERWRPHGVNYMPSSGIGIEDWAYFEHWIGARSYDPEIIQRDFDHIKDMGMNSVSIFIHYPSLESQNLLDLLRRLEVMGMKANLSLRPGTPFDFQWDKMRALIERYRLWDNDTVYAYDLAWEPMFGNHEGRKRWDPEWREWLVERYGSIESAEKDWEFQAPREPDGEVTNPLDPHVVEDGPHWRMMAAYRRFLDTILYKYYDRARRLVHSVDPNHLVSFRMTLAGDPTVRWSKTIPYDYAYLAGAVDILEPEAYGRIGDWERVKPGWFTYEYGRWANPDLPLMWAEAGVSVWSRAIMTQTEERLNFQAQFYTDMYRMMLGSGADGIYWWWYPGGYRANERSDFGIINPDGTDRPVTKVIREHAETFLNAPSASPVDYRLTFDRDPHPDGIAGIYDEIQDEFWAAIDNGKTLGLRTEGAGTTSADCPLTAVGNVEYNGTNPPKYLDGFFDIVEIRNAAGECQEVKDGGEVAVGEGKPVVARLTVTN